MSTVSAVSFSRVRAATENFAEARLIGSGATGDVYSGQIEDQAVAVKLLNLPEVAAPTAKAALQRTFHRELAVLSSYRNPRLVRLQHFAQDTAAESRHPFALVFELLEGGSLADWLRCPSGEPARRTRAGGLPLTALQRIDIALGAASGVAFLHGQREVDNEDDAAPAAGGAGGPRASRPAAASDPGAEGAAPVLHRDIKSANIGLAILRDGTIYSKLLDCGLAKALRGPGAAPAPGLSATVTAGVLGTPGYMAPELTDGVATIKSEIYAFGVVLLELLTGSRVSPPEARTTRRAIEDARGLGPLLARADAVWPAPAAAALARLILECIAEREELRPESMPAIVQRLQQIRALLPLPPAAAGAAGRAGAGAAAGRLIECCVCYEEVPEPSGVYCKARARPGAAAAAGAGAGDAAADGAGPAAAAGDAAAGDGDCHFTCLPCLQQHVLDSATADRLHRTEGRISCPASADAEGCPAWDITDLQDRLERPILAQYGRMLAAAAFDAARARREAAAAQAAREAAVRDAALARGERVRRMRLLIVERDLTLHCPRCAAAFVDYDACNAVACQRCQCAFCSVCLVDCGHDAHPHYYATHGAATIFSERAFHDANRQRRTAAVVAALRAEADAGLRAAVADALEPDLRDLGIDAAAVRRDAGVLRPAIAVAGVRAAEEGAEPGGAAAGAAAPAERALDGRQRQIQEEMRQWAAEERRRMAEAERQRQAQHLEEQHREMRRLEEQHRQRVEAARERLQRDAQQQRQQVDEVRDRLRREAERLRQQAELRRAEAAQQFEQEQRRAYDAQRARRLEALRQEEELIEAQRRNLEAHARLAHASWEIARPCCSFAISCLPSMLRTAFALAVAVALVVPPGTYAGVPLLILVLLYSIGALPADLPRPIEKVLLFVRRAFLTFAAVALFAVVFLR